MNTFTKKKKREERELSSADAGFLQGYLATAGGLVLVAASVSLLLVHVSGWFGVMITSDMLFQGIMAVTSIVTLPLILFTVFVQRIELIENRKEMQNQRLESKRSADTLTTTTKIHLLTGLLNAQSEALKYYRSELDSIMRVKRDYENAVSERFRKYEQNREDAIAFLDKRNGYKFEEIIKSASNFTMEINSVIGKIESNIEELERIKDMPPLD